MSEATASRAYERFEHHFDPTDPQLGAEMFEVLAHLRAECPVARSDQHGGFWVLTRYDHVRDALRDWETFSSAGGVSIPRPEGLPMLPPLEIDPPVQREWRHILNPHFTPAVVNTYEPGMRRIVGGLIDRVIEAGECEIVADIAAPYPGLVYFEEVLAVDPAELAQVTAWIDEIVHHPGPRSGAAYAAFEGWLAAFLERRRDHGPRRGDSVDALLDARIEGEPPPFDELVATLMVLIFGGLDTTSHAIGNICLHLARDPELAAWLGDDLSRVLPSLDEFLRIESPSVYLARTATRDVEVGGCPIRKGDRVAVYWASANRDETEFTDPDRLDLERERNRHLSFGLGMHRCIGSSLARVQLTVAIEEIVARLQDLRLVEGSKVTYAGTRTTRGPDALPVRFTPGPRLGG